jgi:amidase
LIDRPPVALVDYLEAAERLWALGRRIQTGWGRDDVLLTPTLTRLPAQVGGMQAQAGVTDDAGRFSAFVRVWNITGQPAVSLPFAETGAGVPVGVQLVGAHGCDDVLLGLAGQLEAAAGWKPAARVAAPA